MFIPSLFKERKMRRVLRPSVAIISLLVMLLALTRVISVTDRPPIALASGMWNFTGSMHTPRALFTLTQFHNGKVLATGGVNGSSYLSSAELYNPSTGTWKLTGSMSIARFNHTATLLPNGKVLVAGGSCSASSCSALATAELYNPSTGTWSLTGGMNAARENHTATLLSNGEVLVAGGDDGNQPFVKVLSSAELYNPATGKWTLTGSMHTARFNHSATTLGNGKVLFAGGDNGAGDCCAVNSPASHSRSSDIPNSPCFCPHGIASAELYDPATGKWSRTGRLNTPRTLFTATSIPDGTFRVVVAGGIQCNIITSICKTYSSAEIYDPATGNWTLTGSLNKARYGHAAAQLSPGTGQVIVSGGFGSSTLASAEVFSVSTGTWSLTGSMNNARSFHRSLRLHNGQVLVAGGSGVSTAELFTP